MDPGNPQPRWRIVLDGADISSRIDPRFMSLAITACRADDADQLDLSISDHDGRLALPRTGVTVQVSLGWDTTGLTDMGTFVVDEVEHSGTPDHVTLRARSLHLASVARQKRDQSWHATTLGAIVTTLAQRNDLTPLCARALQGVSIGHVDQTNESDINFLTRLGKRYDAVATAKAGNLLFAPIGAGTSPSGAVYPAITLTRRAGDQHRYHAADRDAYTGVRAYWHDVGAARRRSVLAGKASTGNAQGIKILRTTYANETDAMAAATAEWGRVQRGATSFSLQLARGRADLYPEMRAAVVGFKPPIDAIEWLLVRVSHRLDDSGFTTEVECENADAPPSQASDED